MSFRERLRETLDFIGMEQKELAEKSGLSLKTIQNYVKKDSSVPLADKAVIVAQALGVSVEYLITGKKTKKADHPAVHAKYKETIDLLSQLNNDNYEFTVTFIKGLLTLQAKTKSHTPKNNPEK